MPVHGKPSPLPTKIKPAKAKEARISGVHSAKIGPTREKGSRRGLIACGNFSTQWTEIEPAKASESQGKLQSTQWSGPQSLGENKEIIEAAFSVGTLMESAAASAIMLSIGMSASEY